MNVRTLIGYSLLCVSACRDPGALNGTAVLVTTETMALELDQLRYEGSFDGGEAFEPALRPALPSSLVPSSTTVRVLLSDETAREALEVRVVGLRLGTERAEGRAVVEIAGGLERAVTVRLVPPPAGCGSCAGCCASTGACLSPSLFACGAVGSPCIACDGLTADSCGADGRCRCGAGLPCSTDSGGDRCVAGTCRCGDGAACTVGRACLQRTCQCTPASCGGCCQEGQCITAPSRASCGSNGSACLDCGASACTGGQCAAALCNTTTCASGCCSGARCETGREVTACGVGGAACTSCGAGTCDAGVCTPRCGPQTCNGCCDGSACVNGSQDRACGRNGAACVDCARADEQCRGGTCRD
jgi:hypothetical protein